ncbi:hypothetical protein GCM10009854_22790 [Saccharopolyspora halophila]|uniref:Uncharacterized protein n=1 Tax=Saccharopolyspora halophila TaxID=405551 RepID=A0ABN3G6T2_9PSEU
MIEVLALRQQWCRPGEPILWCERTTLGVEFDVEGLDRSGEPQRSRGARTAFGAVGKAAGTVLGVAEAVAGSDGGSELIDPPVGVVFGPGPDCSAAHALSRVPENERAGCWVLTPDRLGWASIREEAAEPEESQGLLGGAMRFGRGAAKFARDLATQQPDHEPGVAVPVPRASPQLEIARSEIVEISAHQRKFGNGYKWHKPWYLRVRLSDGSGFDLGRSEDESRAQRAVAMARGSL